MEWSSPLIRGTLVRRYKRFFADVELDNGEVVTAHCANPGSMMGLKDPGLPAYISTHNNPKRKLRYSLEAVEIKGDMVGINTSLPNKLGEEAIAANAIKELSGYSNMRREVKYGTNSRVDILLEDDAKGLAYVEIKNVHFSREPGLAEFPDSVTERGTKHLKELAQMVEDGHRAVMFYVVQRPDCEVFSIAADTDPTYANTFKESLKCGVEVICYDCALTLKDITIRRALPLKL